MAMVEQRSSVQGSTRRRPAHDAREELSRPSGLLLAILKGGCAVPAKRRRDHTQSWGVRKIRCIAQRRLAKL
eukprot:406391-Prymnesium_polylepis.1